VVYVELSGNRKTTKNSQQGKMTALIFIVVGIVLVVALNMESSKTVSSSQIHTDQQKRKFKVLIWALPIIGTMIAMWLINKDIRKKRHQMEEEIAPAIKELGDRLKKLEAGIQRKYNRNKLH
jgi:cytochrome c-type biogenesis protein CcmH/NrfF